MADIPHVNTTSAPSSGAGGDFFGMDRLLRLGIRSNGFCSNTHGGHSTFIRLNSGAYEALIIVSAMAAGKVLGYLDKN